MKRATATLDFADERARLLSHLTDSLSVASANLAVASETLAADRNDPGALEALADAERALERVAIGLRSLVG